MKSECVNRPLSLILIECHNVTLASGTFDISDGNRDRQSGLHTHLPVNVAFFTLTVTLTLGVNKALGIWGYVN